MTDKRKYDLYSQAYKQNTHATLKAMQTNDPWLEQPGFDGKTTIVFPTRYEDIEAILKDDRHFVRDARNAIGDRAYQLSGVDAFAGNHMLNKDWDDHRRLRNLVSKAFTPKLVREMRGRIQQIADELIAGVIRAGQMDLIGDYAYHLPTIVIAEILGIPKEDRSRFKDWTAALVTPSLDPEEQGRMGALVGEFISYIQAKIAERRAAPGDDLMCSLIRAEDEGERLNDQELVSMIVLLIIAGHETTVNLLGNAMFALFHHPAKLAELKDHPEWMPQAVEEFLRYDGPVERALVRWVAQDTTVNGHLLKQGTLIIPMLAAANRDPAVFSSPDKLDFHREATPHIAFGKGVHYCVGAPLARLEGEIGLNALLGSLPNLRPTLPFDQLQYRLIPMFHGLEALPVEWDTD